MRRFNPNWQRPRKKNNFEGHLQLQCIHYLKLKGFTVGKIKSFGLKNRFDIYMWRGLPDLMIFTPQLTFLELKILPNKIKENTPQDDFRKLCNKANIPHYEINSLEQLQKIFP